MSKAREPGALDDRVRDVLASLERLGTRATRESMAGYGIHATKAFGVPIGTMQAMAKRLGRNHELAHALWETGWYEARILAGFIDEPERVTPAQMDRWCRDFDNWGICDTVCFHLFDRTPHGFRKVEQWAGRKDEFVKRGAFALLACLALHDKHTGDEAFLRCFPLIKRAASDDRNFVKKGVSWALRLIGRRNLELNRSAVELAQRLAESPEPAARWIGRGAVRELTSPAVIRRLHAKRPTQRRQ